MGRYQWSCFGRKREGIAVDGYLIVKVFMGKVELEKNDKIIDLVLLRKEDKLKM
jgi:hypothetical protein